MKVISNGSNDGASEIISNDTLFELISWECNDENAVLSLCEGVHVGGHVDDVEHFLN